MITRFAPVLAGLYVRLCQNDDQQYEVQRATAHVEPLLEEKED